MSVMKLDIELSKSDLLRAVAQLPPSELKEFVRDILALNATKTTDVLSESETDLLQKINRGLPAALQTRMLALIDKRQFDALTPAEVTELQEISAQVEALNLERMTHLTALAQLRRVPLGKLVQDLGLRATYA